MLTGVVHYERAGLPDIGVGTRRFEGRNTRLSSRVVEGPPHGFNNVYSSFEELWRSLAWGYAKETGTFIGLCQGCVAVPCPL